MLGENIERDSWLYALAAHDYYWNNGDLNVMSDQEYDALTNILRINWSEIPMVLQWVFKSPEELGQGAVHIKLNNYQLEKALQVHRDQSGG